MYTRTDDINRSSSTDTRIEGHIGNANNGNGGSFDRVFGYVRVSSRDQNEARQMNAMLQFGVYPENIFLDKQSGKDFNRPAYRALLGTLKPGDVFVVKAIDRLGRNYDEIIEQWRFITKMKKAAIVVIDMPLLDTRTSRDLMGTLISELVLQLLSYVAETERQFIRQRQREGIEAARARGVHMGAPALPVPENFPEIYARWEAGEITARSAAKLCGVCCNTFLKWARSKCE